MVAKKKKSIKQKGKELYFVTFGDDIEAEGPYDQVDEAITAIKAALNEGDCCINDIQLFKVTKECKLKISVTAED